jgi:retron-type reverse transcriptase
MHTWGVTNYGYSELLNLVGGYAVKKVTSNKGKNTSGIDKKLWSTSSSKMKAVLTLSDKHYGIVKFSLAPKLNLTIPVATL